jgi:glycosyltransferase involved in cell wall biosynthesis
MPTNTVPTKTVSTQVKPLIVSRTDIAGGAARAAARLVGGLNGAGVGADMLVAVREQDHSWTHGGGGFANLVSATLRAHAGRMLVNTLGERDPGLRSLNLLPSRLDRRINGLPCDVVNLHWIGGEMLSVEAIGRIARPVVWTLHDMWAFTGGEHYTEDGDTARWRHGYAKGTRPAGGRGMDLDRSTWLRKQRAWRRPQHVIAPTRWLADCARQSTLMRDWPVHVVPNLLDLSVFRPWPKDLARQMLGLPLDVPLLGFGAMGGTRDLRKGWDLLRAALDQVAQDAPHARAVIFGQSRPRGETGLPMESHWIGQLSDDAALALLYSAIDVMVVPSRQDNLPQTATEAQACGCPVVAFATCGLFDAVESGETGLLAAPFEIGELAAAIVTLLTDAARREAQGKAARERALRLWNAQGLVEQHMAIYRQAIADYA